MERALFREATGTAAASPIFFLSPFLGREVRAASSGVGQGLAGKAPGMRRAPLKAGAMIGPPVSELSGASLKLLIRSRAGECVDGRICLQLYQ